MQYFEGLNIRQEGGDIKCGQPHLRKEAERRLSRRGYRYFALVILCTWGVSWGTLFGSVIL